MSQRINRMTHQALAQALEDVKSKLAPLLDKRDRILAEQDRREEVRRRRVPPPRRRMPEVIHRGGPSRAVEDLGSHVNND